VERTSLLGELGSLGAVALGVVVWGFFGNALALRRLGREQPELARGFPAAVGRAVAITVALLLFDGLAGHNLYRYTWLWFGAFQAVALGCLTQQAAKLASREVVEPSLGAGFAVGKLSLGTAAGSRTLWS